MIITTAVLIALIRIAPKLPVAKLIVLGIVVLLMV
mgnify:CR=1 FL=1